MKTVIFWLQNYFLQTFKKTLVILLKFGYNDNRLGNTNVTFQGGSVTHMRIGSQETIGNGFHTYQQSDRIRDAKGSAGSEVIDSVNGLLSDADIQKKIIEREHQELHRKEEKLEHQVAVSKDGDTLQIRTETTETANKEIRSRVVAYDINALKQNDNELKEHLKEAEIRRDAAAEKFMISEAKAKRRDENLASAVEVSPLRLSAENENEELARKVDKLAIGIVRTFSKQEKIERFAREIDNLSVDRRTDRLSDKEREKMLRIARELKAELDKRSGR